MGAGVAAFAGLLVLLGPANVAFAATGHGANSSLGSGTIRALPDIRITSDVRLTSDLYCHDLSVAAGVTLTTQGHLIACTGSVNVLGTLVGGRAGPVPIGAIRGSLSSSTSSVTPQPLFSSYGGSGGGGLSVSCSANASSGYSTRAPGGSGAASYVYNASNGSTPATASLSRNTVVGWALEGMQNFLSGAFGQPVCSGRYLGGAGGYGLYVQGSRVHIANIDTSGAAGTGTCSGYGLSGSGGGGSIVVAWGAGGYYPGNISDRGGGYVWDCAHVLHSGGGGNGSVMTLHFGGAPPISGPFLFAPTIASGSCVSVSGQLAASPSSPASGRSATVLWNDGNRSKGNFPLFHTYARNGSYSIAAIRTYANGSSVVGYETLRLPAPSVSAPEIRLADILIGNGSVTVDGLVGLNACGSAHLHPYHITWGDTTSSASYLPSSHSYAAPGTYKICLSVTDSLGTSSQVCTKATVP